MRQATQRLGYAVITGLFVLTVLAVSIVSPQIAHAIGPYAGGDGTEENPWQISTPSQLQDFDDNDGRRYFELVNDITVPADFQPQEIINVSLDGNGHKISGLANPLFWLVEDSTIKNLRVSGTINNSYDLTNDMTLYNFGIFAGSIRSSDLDTVLVEGSLALDLEMGEGSDCANIGGVTGSIDDSTFTRVASLANVSAPECNGVGGLAGEVEDSEITESFATGDVTGLQDVGGLIGLAHTNYTDTEVINAYARGNVTALSYAGGLIGNTLQGEGYVHAINTYFTGSVTADGPSGGLIGYSQGTVINSYSVSLVTNNEGNGGFVGELADSGRIHNAAWVRSGNDNAIGYINYMWDCDFTYDGSLGILGPDNEYCDYGNDHDSASELKYNGFGGGFAPVYGQSTEGAWDFDNIWTIDENHDGENDGFPYFGWVATNFTNEENTPPTDGGQDLNGDNIPDSEQPYVTAFENDNTKKTVVIELGGACTADVVTVRQESQLAVADAGYDYANGFIGFTADCGTPGYSMTVKIFFYDVEKADLILRKHNPNTNAFFNLTSAHGASLEQTTINGQTVTVASYQITDGGELDIDGQANGEIADPVGLASLAVGVPNTGLGGKQTN